MRNVKPYIASSKKIPEFTFRALFLGIILGLLFGLGNAYLGLRVGTTVSASIPAAVMSMAILRTFFKQVSILENNLVQTIASVGEGLAAGIVFTIPALFLLGDIPSFFHIFLLSVLGGILGVLLMIPMRRYIIVEEHGKLTFPEGTACAEILKAGEKKASGAKLAIMGILVGSLYKILSNGLHLFKEVAAWKTVRFLKTEFSIDCTPALLGVGFIVGPQICALLLFGGLLAWWVLIPLISKFGGQMAIIAPASIAISQMSAEQIWDNYIRYMGAGAVGIGGLFSLIKIIPMLGKTLKSGIKEVFVQSHRKVLPRTDRDISLRWLIIGSVAIILFLWLFPGLKMNLLTIVLLSILSFFFVGVTSITVGLVGSTSSPVSGMTITTLLIVCLIFLGLGWTERIYLIAALTMSIVSNIAVCLASTTSQDLKTGFLLGATPRSQQVAEIIGIFLPAIAISGAVFLLNKAYTFGSTAMPAPQGTLMALIAKGVITGKIPFGLVFIGVVLGLLVALLRLPILPFAIGLYLPLSLSTGMMLGGIVSAIVNRSKKPEANDRGILAASGLVAGDACTGVFIALFTVLGIHSATAPSLLPDWVSLLTFLILSLGLAKACLLWKKRS